MIPIITILVCIGIYLVLRYAPAEEEDDMAMYNDNYVNTSYREDTSLDEEATPIQSEEK